LEAIVEALQTEVATLHKQLAPALKNSFTTSKPPEDRLRNCKTTKAFDVENAYLDHKTQENA
jgi:hypothetical protein